tara:strand:- start:4138 stop:9144 length:5007 start_codon:yes stop_codon:yes gene_type:complete
MPAVKFTKKGPTPQFSVMPNRRYPDLYDNNLTNFTIQSGTVQEGGKPITRNTMMMVDFLLPEKPEFGSGELKESSIGIYVNSLNMAYGSGIPALQLYKLNKEIGNTEGGKGSAGSLIDNEDIVVISGHSSPNFTSLTEDFQGAGVWNSAHVIGNGPRIQLYDTAWITPEEAFERGDRFGKDGHMVNAVADYKGINTQERAIIHRNTFCSDHPKDGPKSRCYIHDGMFEGWWWYSKNLFDGKAEAFPANKSGHLGWDDENSAGIIRYDYTSGAQPLPGVSDADFGSIALAVSPRNSIFHNIKNEESWVSKTQGDSSGVAVYNRCSLTTENAKEEGNVNCVMESQYPHRFHMKDTHVYYPPKKDYDDVHSGAAGTGGVIHDSENQSVAFMSTKIPLPVHLYTREPSHTAGGRQPLMPQVQFELNIARLPPMLQREQQDYSFTRTGYSNSVTTQSSHPYRLNRSFVVTFSEEEPKTNENLYSFIRKHNTYGTADGTGSGTGQSNSTYVKSLFGLAFVRNKGEMSYYHIENAGRSGSTDTDVSYILDSARGEVCFAAEPTKLDYTPNNFANLVFQLHPDDEGAYWAIYDDDGQISDTDKIKNQKTITGLGLPYSGGSVGVSAINSKDYFPKFMTLWNNAYPSLRSVFNKTAGRWEAGISAPSATTSATQPVQVIDAGGEWRGGANDGGITCTPYAVLGAGDKLQWGDKDDGSSLTTETYITEMPRSETNSRPMLLLAASIGTSVLDTAYLHNSQDAQMSGPNDNMGKSDIYINSIKFNHFNFQHDNSTVSEYGHNDANIPIYKTQMLPSTGWEGLSGASSANIKTAECQQPCYISLGFDTLADVQGTLATNTAKFLLLNNYTTNASFADGVLITNNDSDESNIRVGFTSDVENYGRQGAASSTISTAAAIKPDIGNGESPVFGNNEGSPNYTNRGLVVGDLDLSGREFSVETTDTRTTDLFTAKGTIQYQFGVRVTDSGDETSNDGNAVVAAGATSFKVGDGANFTDEQFIKIEDEIMKITNISSNTLTVTRGIEGTSDVEHPDAVTIFHCAVPQKRENIFASARILAVRGPNGREILVDDKKIFENREDEDYIIYKYGENYKSSTDIRKDTNFKITQSEGNWLTLDTGCRLDSRTGGLSATGDGDDCCYYLISPKKYWLIIEIMNLGGAHGWQSLTSSHQILPRRQYQNIVALNELGTVGATYNESLYTDGQNINVWNLSTITENENGLVSLKDYGFGPYDDQTKTGGHVGYQQLGHQDTNKYLTANMNKVIEVDKLQAGDTLPILITTPGIDDGFKVNIDTEEGTFPLYMSGVFEDELPTVSNFNVEPADDPYNFKFTWETQDDDIWYGFIMIDEHFIHNQYQNAVIHLPMNEEGDDGAKATTAPVENIQGLTTSVESTATTGPFYDIEGLAGYCLRCNGTGSGSSSPFIKVGTGSQDVLNQTNYATTTEMSFVLHFTHDEDTDGTLSAGQEHLLFKDEVMELTIEANGTIKYKQYWDSNSYIELTSASIIPLNGKNPTCVMVTFDGMATNGNVKLFIDGKLEDLTGEVIIADATGAQTGWRYGYPIESNNNALYLTNGGETHSSEFLGQIEEFVVYNKCIYPVDPLVGDYTLIKHLEEVSDNNNYAPPKSYSAKLFIKDYHNIRGSTVRDVCTSSGVTLKKSSFRMNTN